MDLNIVKIVNSVNGSNYVRYVSANSKLPIIDVCVLATEAKLFTRTTAETVLNQVSQCLAASDAIVSIVPLGEIDKQTDLRPPKGDLSPWYETGNVDRTRLISFLEGNTENLTMHSERFLTGGHQFFVGEVEGHLQLVVSLPGIWTREELLNGLDYIKYGFTGYATRRIGTGKGMFTVFTFTQ